MLKVVLTHLITVSSVLHPFAETNLRFLILVIVCGVDEVAALVLLDMGSSSGNTIAFLT